ncbi:ubiquinol-cytochrome C reductase hinge domain-containing protein [Papiliotrema laurentii]|uniref:Ubiquinol-cytochrome C reductase hinge domain-containing protein n=1 Tax=Papiliotrema laurentii TaxID=5418 RepID=A0AAD9CUX0_PAPLA|nr:ubiquinol-cytochrome C reductase hinge domain-containing protein [Papiliotrema laurentii]
MSTEFTTSGEQSGAASFVSSLASWFLPTAHAEEETEEKEEESTEEAEEPAAEEEEEEEEEPEDIAPAIREECEKNECSEPAKHFKHCAEKVEAGKGWHGEDCVEELFHLMHCVDHCAAPKVFKKLA